MSYELMYIVRPTLDEEALARVHERVDKFVTNAGGTLVKREEWGKRRLAFPVAKFTEGFYSVLQITLAPPAVRALERNLQLTEDVLRYLITRVEEA